MYNLAFLLLSLLPVSSCFWILSHQPLISERLDPIVNGRNTSSHVHSFVGSAAILGKKKKNACTTSVVKDDKSRYWSPQLYYYSAASKKFSSIPLSFVNTYYLNRGGPSMGKSPVLKAFPRRFKMIAGNSTSFNGPVTDTTAAKAVSFVCLDYKNGTSYTDTLPKGPCPDGLRTQIVFPSCWDGMHLDSENHQSHVSYPINGFPDNGDCPKSHPIKLITLFYEFIWNTGNFESGKNGTFVLANGDTKGWTFHADFISGWNVEVLQNAIDQCTGDVFGDVEKCAPFLKSIDRRSQCKTTPILAENAIGPFKSLPGCNTIKNGPYKNIGSCVESSQRPHFTKNGIKRLY